MVFASAPTSTTTEQVHRATAMCGQSLAVRGTSDNLFFRMQLKSHAKTKVKVSRAAMSKKKRKMKAKTMGENVMARAEAKLAKKLAISASKVNRLIGG